MTGLSILYAKGAAEERDWAAVPDRDRPGRLREVYWANRGEMKSRRNPAVNASLRLPLDRTAVGRRRDEPGDSFVFLVSMAPQVEERFEWLEVTEVFTTVTASQTEGAMRAWNGITDKHPVDFDAFRQELRRGRPSKLEQRCAADRVIAQIERKLAKKSYGELLETYGYGTLVVGMPLWFAVPPDDPFRAENAIDDFMTRTTIGLEELKRSVLRKRDCPFRNVIVVWDTTPEALREWRAQRSAAYMDPANTPLGNPFGLQLLDRLPEGLENAIAKTRVPENEAPSMGLHLDAKTIKEAPGKGPFPAIVVALAESFRKGSRRPVGRWSAFRTRVVFALCKLLCFVRLYGLAGLERRLTRKVSVSHALKRRSVRRRARRFYRESRRRGRVFCVLAQRD